MNNGNIIILVMNKPINTGARNLRYFFFLPKPYFLRPVIPRKSIWKKKKWKEIKIELWNLLINQRIKIKQFWRIWTPQETHNDWLDQSRDY